MIFKTNNDKTGITNIFKEYSKVKDVFNTLDKETTRNVIKAFNNTSLSVDDLSDKFGGLDTSVITYLNTTKRGKASMQDLKASLDNSSSSMGIATIKAKALSIALNALTGLVLITAIKGIVWIFDELITTLDEQREKLDKTKTLYNESRSELEQLNNELKTAGERVDELNSKENLTFTEKDELKKLKETNDELERKIFLLEKANQESEKDVADEAQNLYNKYTNGRVYDLGEQVDFYENSSLLKGVNWDDYKNDISWLIAQYNNQQALLKNAQDNGWYSLVQQAKDNIVLLEGYMADASSEYTSLYETISGLNDTSMTPELESAKSDLNEILNLVATILGYDGELKQSSFEDIWNAEDFSKYKDEIIEFSKNGELTPEVLSSNEHYKRLLEETGLTADETAEHINALVKEVQDLTLNNETPVLTISDTITKLDALLRPAFDSLKSAYQSIFTDNGFTLKNVDLSMLDSIKSSIDDLNEIDGIEVDTSGFESLVNVLTDSSSTAEETQGAFNDFATSILQDTNILNNMNDSTAQLIQSMLESMGVQNAEVIVSQQLAMAHGELAAQKLYLASTGQELESVSIDEQNAFILEKIASGELGKELAILQLKKMLVNGTLLNESSDINQVLALAQAAGMSVEALTQLKIIKDKFNSAASIGDKNAMDSLSQQASALNAKIKDEVSNFQPVIDFNGNVGKSASKAGKKAADAYKEAFEKELKELQGLRDTGAISEKEYLDRLRELNIRYFKDKEKYLDEYRRYEKEYYDGMIAVYDRVASAATKAIDKQVKSLDKQKNALNDQIDQLEKQKDTVEEYYDAQIQAIEKAKDATEKYYQDQIQTLEDEKDAMEKANEARENAFNLQKAQFELERMQNQKTKLVYKDGQLVWQKDTTGIRDKKEEVEKAKYDIAITNINNQVDNLNKSMDEALEKFEEQIKALEESRDKEIAAIDLQIKGLESQIEVIDKQRDALEEYKELWSEVANDYQEQQDALLAAQVLGADWEAQIMSGRLSVLEDFKNKYAGLYSAMAQIYAESTGGNVTMPSISSEGNSASGSGLNSGSGATGAVTTNGGGAGGNIFTLPGVESEEWGATLDEIIAKLQAFKETFQTEWDEIVDITASSVGVSSGGSDKKPSQDNKKKEAESAAGGIIGILQDGALSMDTVFQEEWLETFRKLIEDDPSLTSYCNNIVEQITSMCDQIIEQLSTATSHINLFMGALQNLGLNGGGKGASASDWLSNLPKRASGLRNAKKPELAVTNEAGPELIYSPSLGGFITPIQPGDSVFKNALTNNLFDWGAISPLQYQDQLMRSINTIPSVEPRTENINVTQNVTFNCPNLTNDSGMQYVMRQFRNLELQAHQRAHMRK